jgi:hydroxymethylpyrimidine/phosphomethylpyrimidine kinase
MHCMRTALTIAGSDPSGGAGIQADLKTFAAHHVYGLSVITAVTAQNTTGVAGFEALSSDLVALQLETIVSDIRPDAAKTGMLGTAAVVEAVAAAVADLDIPLLVVDPVMVAKSGDSLIDDEAVAAVKTELLRRALVVTPNVPEAEVLSGITIRTEHDRREAAKLILALGPSAVIIKGGHLGSAAIVDLLYDGHRFQEFGIDRVAGRNTHGTGCAFAAALAAHLALGHSLADAVPDVQRYIAGAIARAPNLGRGHGPMDHFWKSNDPNDPNDPNDSVY